MTLLPFPHKKIVFKKVAKKNSYILNMEIMNPSLDIIFPPACIESNLKYSIFVISNTEVHSTSILQAKRSIKRHLKAKRSQSYQFNCLLINLEKSKMY